MSNERRPGGLRPWHVILGIFILLILAVILWFFIQASSVESQLEALRAEGQPTSYAEWAEKHQLPPGVDNAANTYLMAVAAYVSPTDTNTPYGANTKMPPRGTPLPEAMVRAGERHVADNQQTLALLRQAGAIEHCYYNSDYSVTSPPLKEMRGCARLLAAAALLRAYQGDAAAIPPYIEDGLRMARSFRNEPTLICYLVGLACIGSCTDALERALSMTTFTDAQLAEVDRMLAETASSLDLTQVLVGERCGTIEMIRDPSLIGGGGGVLKVPGVKSVGLADMLHYMGDCIEASKLPPIERVAGLKQIGEELDKLSGLHVVAKILAPAFGRVAEIDLNCRAELDMARTAVAIERYRLATGKVPEALGTLVPDYLNQVPIDPYDGQPIRYRPTETGYLLYSLGPDAKDNAGQSHEEVVRDAPYDLPFAVTR